MLALTSFSEQVIQKCPCVFCSTHTIRDTPFADVIPDSAETSSDFYILVLDN